MVRRFKSDSQRKAVMAKLRKAKIPFTMDVLQSSEFGKKTLHQPEIRVWAHPKKGGDDFYFRLRNPEQVKKLMKNPPKDAFLERTPLVAWNGVEMKLTDFNKFIKQRGIKRVQELKALTR